MTYTTNAPTSSPFSSRAYRSPRKVQAQANNPYANMEFQLVAHIDYGIVGRLYSPNRNIDTTNSTRTILSNTGKVVFFYSTTADYKQLSKLCRPSNLTANRIRTQQILQELEGLREPKWTNQQSKPATRSVPKAAKAVDAEPKEVMVGKPNSEKEISTSPIITPPPADTFIPLALPAAAIAEPQPEATTTDTTPVTVVEPDEVIEIEHTVEDCIDLRATLKAMTATKLSGLVKQISIPFSGKRRKNQYIEFLMVNAEETVSLVS